MRLSFKFCWIFLPYDDIFVRCKYETLLTFVKNTANKIHCYAHSAKQRNKSNMIKISGPKTKNWEYTSTFIKIWYQGFFVLFVCFFVLFVFLFVFILFSTWIEFLIWIFMSKCQTNCYKMNCIKRNEWIYFLQSINFQFMVLGYMQMVVKIYPNVLTFH